MCFSRHPECLHWNHFSFPPHSRWWWWWWVTSVATALPWGQTDRRYYTCALYTRCNSARSLETWLRFPQQIKHVRFWADSGCNQVMQPHVAGRKWKNRRTVGSAGRWRPQEMQKSREATSDKPSFKRNGTKRRKPRLWDHHAWDRGSFSRGNGALWRQQTASISLHWLQSITMPMLVSTLATSMLGTMKRRERPGVHSLKFHTPEGEEVVVQES